MHNALSKPNGISLEEIASVSLLKRIDHKYLMNIKTLPNFIEALADEYYVVEIAQKRILPYFTIYFDTPNLHYYHLHHNGKLNRYKFRSRQYIVGGQVFNEVKFKINKGKTFKSRIKRSTLQNHFDEKFESFAKQKCPTIKSGLYPTLNVEYNRITFVDKNFSERMTIDTDLRVSHKQQNHYFENLIIIELKRDQGNKNSQAEKVLKSMRCKKNGFSKYCIGVAKTHENVKKNLFKEKFRLIEKLYS